MPAGFSIGSKQRIRRKSVSSPQSYSTDGLRSRQDIWEFDDRYTAPLFGFGTAENYYRTQSSHHFLAAFVFRRLIVTAKDDPLVPFEIFDHPSSNEIRLLRLPHRSMAGISVFWPETGQDSGSSNLSCVGLIMFFTNTPGRELTPTWSRPDKITVAKTMTAAERLVL